MARTSKSVPPTTTAAFKPLLSNLSSNNLARSASRRSVQDFGPESETTEKPEPLPKSATKLSLDTKLASKDFQKLLDELAAEHQRVCAWNSALQEQVTGLLAGGLGRSSTLDLSKREVTGPLAGGLGRSSTLDLSKREDRAQPNASVAAKKVVVKQEAPVKSSTLLCSGCTGHRKPPLKEEEDLKAPVRSLCDGCTGHRKPPMKEEEDLKELSLADGMREEVDVIGQGNPRPLPSLEDRRPVPSLEDVPVGRQPTEVQSTETMEDTFEVAAATLLPPMPRSCLGELQAAELHATWERSEGHDSNTAIHMSRTRSVRKLLNDDRCMRAGDTKTENNCLQRFIAYPSSRRRMAWDLTSLVVLFYDILTVPLVSFDIPESTGHKVMDMFCIVFWTLDMPASMMTGFDKGGILEMRPSKILQSYLTHWFIFDFVVIAVDWMMVATSSGMAELVGILRLSKIMRMFRVVRLVRLLRLLKMPTLLDEIGDYIHSEHLFTSFGVMRSLAIIAVVNHFIACGWYAIGSLGEPSWVQRMDEEDRSIGYRYVTSLHWSLTQFTPSSMEIFPRNALERTFAILVLFTALVVFSSFVSSITNAMTQLHLANQQRSKQRVDIRKYLSDNKLSLDLGNRIITFVRKYKASNRKRVHEEEISILKALPESLRVQLHWEVFLPVLLPHPFFWLCNEHNQGCTLEICHYAMGEMSLVASQELFTAGQTASKMFFVQTGYLEYFNDLSDIELARVEKPHWCVEVVLWLKWEHEGRLAAVPHCELIFLEATIFRKYISYRPDIKDVCKEYAQRYKKRCDDGGFNAPLDIWSDHDTISDMAQESFRVVEKEDALETKVRMVLRPWRTLSLRRKKKDNWRLKRSNSVP